ncbi:MAG: bifunctional ADP-dependent NAD(P)H-hydrate dehydratase/NAD(P)H-hydrate epimerase [Treponema sp.]|jgi:NAD(P)H-hydrate epimerase|nr:bifunctional ADP-dependent NAD(P)H-hydrate dehydratase/NAD(P)H-hydrate epimerase [Treponema sp.]
MIGTQILKNSPVPAGGEKLFSAESAQAVDTQAYSWGFDPFALVEAAGRCCARVFTGAFPALFSGSPSSGNPRGFPRIVVAVGSGNNGADAMVMLRALILEGYAAPTAVAVVINRLSGNGEHTPRSEALRVLGAMGVPVYPWQEGNAGKAALAGADVIIDGIAGTGLRGPLSAAAGEMAAWIRACKIDAGDTSGGPRSPLVVSVDIPSGNFDRYEPSMPIIGADLTLAIDPKKMCLYAPAARPFAGKILSVGGVFPPGLMQAFEGPELLTWREAAGRLPPIPPDAYKYERGLAEIRAGSVGRAGAARIAARGAQAAGAGIVRLLVDEALYPVLAASSGGIMVVPARENSTGIPDSGGETPETDPPEAGRFCPDAVLLGPGWGRSPQRLPVLQQAVAREAAGTPIVLDADAIALARDITFHGTAILTPHLGEFAAFTGVPKEKILSNAVFIAAETARNIGAVILLKSHVLIIAAEDGRVGIVDGMVPVLAAGGSGDLLAGFCVAIAARMKRRGAYDGYTCAVAAAALLVETGGAPDMAHRFIDPLDLAEKAAALAGAAWL